MNKQQRRENMSQLMQATPVAKPFEFENPIAQLEQMIPFKPFDLIVGAVAPRALKEIGGEGKESTVDILKSMMKDLEAENGY